MGPAVNREPQAPPARPAHQRPHALPLAHSLHLTAGRRGSPGSLSKRRQGPAPRVSAPARNPRTAARKATPTRRTAPRARTHDFRMRHLQPGPHEPRAHFVPEQRGHQLAVVVDPAHSSPRPARYYPRLRARSACPLADPRRLPAAPRLCRHLRPWLGQPAVAGLDRARLR